MGLARDGTHGVITYTWRRIEIDGALYVEETTGGRIGAWLFGPLPDAATCTALMKERAAEVRTIMDERMAELRERFRVMQVGKPPKVLEEDDDE